MIVADRCSTRFTEPRNPWACPRSPTASTSIPIRPASTSKRWSATGIIERVPDPPSGPGRPRVGYRARPGLARGGARRYRELAELLLGHLSATSDDPATTATAVGRTWGAHLVPRPAPFHHVTRDEAVERLTAMLDDLDFAPEPVADEPGPPDRVRLRHCPFLELAEPHRDLVCPLHLGLMQGALAELRAPITVSALAPFAEPTACLAHLAPSPDR